MVLSLLLNNIKSDDHGRNEHDRKTCHEKKVSNIFITGRPFPIFISYGKKR